jgi:uncharacterized membrane protein SpoIIM required for sporulation
MFVKIFEKHWKTHPIKLSFFAGILFTAIAQLTSFILFNNQPHLVGISTIFLTVLFAVPVFSYILRSEEQIERRRGSFFKKNHAIIDYHLYFFLGVLLVFFIVSLNRPSIVFDLGDFLNIGQSSSTISAPAPLFSPVQEFFMILQNNIFITALAVFLCFIFGSGGILLIVLNASIAASLMAAFSGASTSEFLCQVSLFQIHFIPEILGFLLAAIAAGIFFIDIFKEKFMSKAFFQVGIDAALLFILSVTILVGAALLEVYVVKDLFKSEMCMSQPFAPILFLGLFLGLIFFLETHRYKHKRAHKFI